MVITTTPMSLVFAYPERYKKYLSKISDPLPDRIDLHVEVVPVPSRELTNKRLGEQSESIRRQVRLSALEPMMIDF